MRKKKHDTGIYQIAKPNVMLLWLVLRASKLWAILTPDNSMLWAAVPDYSKYFELNLLMMTNTDIALVSSRLGW